MSQTSFEDTVDTEFEGFRLDVYLAERLEDASRAFLQKLIRDGQVTVNNRTCTRAARSVRAGEHVGVTFPAPPSTALEPENLPLEILFQDADLIVVNKPAGMVVHPAPGNYTGTLLNALLFHCPDFRPEGRNALRPGVVHRIDKYTSGVLVVAKTTAAFISLSKQAREHTFDRRYLAIVAGEFEESGGRVTAAVGRSVADRTRMSVTGVRSREAVTRFEVVERYRVASLLSVTLETGRTHQIRVHLRFTGHPVLGDPVYGVTDFSSWRISPELRTSLEMLQGQALHAERLGFVHPISGDRLTFAAPPRPDFQRVLDALRNL
ncbi:MAG: RluA family pseudouridine synthase [Candidatus Hydrogenedentes bacterium]|nr:RluA family pseudouridine synthase [Candidatus Hydrogenedentota bacterium]